ncbi:MAG TPA: hypothetical protein VNH22_01505 [Blastocatellia bacterium]|nr:hypothetical protein [Blastocatellia bacterium]
MKRKLISSFAILAMALAVGSPVAGSVALAAQKKSACSCGKPALKRKTRSARARAAARPGALAARTGAASSYKGSSAEVVGPVFVTYTLPQRQYFRLRMNQPLSSETARAGDRFKTTVVTPVYAGGIEVVPAGSIIEGRVTSAQPARSRGREGQMAVAFDALVLPDGTRHSIDGAMTELQDVKGGEIDQENHITGRSSEDRQLIFIGGGGMGGAVLGGAIGGGKGAAIGAILGAGAGVAGSMLKKGYEAEVKSGTEIGMIITEPVQFSVRSDRYR